MSNSYSSFKPQASNVFNYDHSVISELYIRKLVLRESGTYNPQFARSYETHLQASSVNALVEKASEVGNKAFSPTALSGLASNMISISAAPESNNPLGIKNGWGSARLLFFMDVWVKDISGAQTEYFIQGYTDYSGLSLQSKSLDPQMVFYINNIVTSRIIENGPPSFIDNNHLLHNSKSFNESPMFVMRPEDVYKMLTSSSFARTMHDTGSNMPAVYDNRYNLGRNPHMSKRTNSIASNYTSKLLTGFVTASNLADPVANPTDTYDAATNYVGENNVSLNPFLSALARQRSSGVIAGEFTWSNLLALQPELNNPSNPILVVAVSGPTQMNQSHQAGSTASWASASIETKYAATISQAVPALMLECMLYQVSFSCNNMMNIDTAGFSGIYTVMTNAMSMSGGATVPDIERFRTRLEFEVLKDISYNNQQKFNLTVKSSVFGETWVSIQIDGGPQYDFVTPTFCDGIITPVVTQDYKKLDSMATGIDNLVSQISDATQYGNERTTFTVPGQVGSGLSGKGNLFQGL